MTPSDCKTYHERFVYFLDQMYTNSMKKYRDMWEQFFYNQKKEGGICKNITKKQHKKKLMN